MTKHKDIGKKSLKSNFLWTLLSNLIFGLSQWGIVTLMIRLGNLEMVGTYTLALGLVAPIFLLFNLNLRSVQATDQKSEYSFNDYYILRFLTSIVGLVITMIISFILNYQLITFLTVTILAFIKLVESQSDIHHGLFQQKENMQYIAYSKILRGIFNVVTIGISLYFYNNLIMSIVIMLIVNIILTIYIDNYFTKKLISYNLRIKQLIIVLKKRKMILSLLLVGVPLGIAGALDTFSVNIQRFIIDTYMDKSALGYYASITYIMVSGQSVISALGHATLPRLTNLYNDNIKQYINMLFKLLFFGLVIGILISWITWEFGEFILILLYDSSFANYTEVFFLVMIAASIWYISGFLNIGLLSTRKFKFQSIIYFIAFIVTFVSTLLLIDNGLKGVALGLIYGMLTRLIAMGVTLYLILKKDKLSGELI